MRRDVRRDSGVQDMTDLPDRGVQPELLTGSVRAGDGRIVVTVEGEIDLSTAPRFRALVDEAIAVSAPHVVVDMARVEFCDGQGLAVLAAAAERLRATGGRLEVHRVSAKVYRLFEITGMTQTLHVERATDDAALARGLAQAAGLALTRDVLDSALRLVVTMAQAVVAGADGVSITLPRDGRLGTVAASNDVVLEMDHDQYDTGEGPCLDAATLGERFHITSLGAEARWPQFVPRAKARGIESILSTPLVAGGQPMGALNVYSRKAGAFAEHENAWADQFAAEAARLVVRAGEGAAAQARDGELQDALLARNVIALAQGMIMQRDGIDPSEAYVALRDESRRTGQPVRDICEALVGTSGEAATQQGAAEGAAHVQPQS